MYKMSKCEIAVSVNKDREKLEKSVAVSVGNSPITNIVNASTT